jgi:hypothetical protein
MSEPIIGTPTTTSGAIGQTFADLYKRVSWYIGTGLSPSGNDLIIAQTLVNDGYRMFLTALDPRTKRAYQWSFLSPARTIGFTGGTGGTALYTLPTGFGAMVDDPAYSVASSPVVVQPRSPTFVHERQGISGGTGTGAPMFYAIEPVAESSGNSGNLQLYNMILWPKPDQSYTMHYRYRVLATALANDGDCPLGGPEHSQTILQACLAMAEVRVNERQGEQTALYERLLCQSIDIDALNKPRNLGRIGDNSDYETPYSRIQSVTYNY